MSEYKAPKCSYLELLEIFKKDIVEKPGETDDKKRAKYFAVITSQGDLKANLEYYYENELLKQVFTPTETSVLRIQIILYIIH